MSKWQTMTWACSADPARASSCPWTGRPERGTRTRWSCRHPAPSDAASACTHHGCSLATSATWWHRCSEKKTLHIHLLHSHSMRRHLHYSSNSLVTILWTCWYWQKEEEKSKHWSSELTFKTSLSIFLYFILSNATFKHNVGHSHCTRHG